MEALRMLIRVKGQERVWSGGHACKCVGAAHSCKQATGRWDKQRQAAGSAMPFGVAPACPTHTPSRAFGQGYLSQSRLAQASR